MLLLPRHVKLRWLLVLGHDHYVLLLLLRLLRLRRGVLLLRHGVVLLRLHRWPLLLVLLQVGRLNRMQLRLLQLLHGPRLLRLCQLRHILR